MSGMPIPSSTQATISVASTTSVNKEEQVDEIYRDTDVQKTVKRSFEKLNANQSESNVVRPTKFHKWESSDINALWQLVKQPESCNPFAYSS